MELKLIAISDFFLYAKNFRSVIFSKTVKLLYVSFIIASSLVLKNIVCVMVICFWSFRSFMFVPFSF